MGIIKNLWGLFNRRAITIDLESGSGKIKRTILEPGDVAEVSPEFTISYNGSNRLHITLDVLEWTTESKHDLQ